MASANIGIHPDSTWDPAFARVAEAFAGNFSEHGELGAAVSIRVAGRPVVDLFGGFCDAARTRRWQRDTLVNAYSVGKGLLSVLTLALDLPVAALWPEFAAAGKSDITLRTLLAHRAGLPGVRRLLAPDAMLDWNLMCRELAAQQPWWEPDSAFGDHVNTFGYLVGALVRRATGMDVGRALQQFVMQPSARSSSTGCRRNTTGGARRCRLRIG